MGCWLGAYLLPFKTYAYASKRTKAFCNCYLCHSRWTIFLHCPGCTHTHQFALIFFGLFEDFNYNDPTLCGQFIGHRDRRRSNHEAMNMEDQMEEANEQADVAYADADIDGEHPECDCGSESFKTWHIWSKAAELKEKLYPGHVNVLSQMSSSLQTLSECTQD